MPFQDVTPILNVSDVEASAARRRSGARRKLTQTPPSRGAMECHQSLPHRLKTRMHEGIINAAQIR
jgi:hypothetical protein